MTSIEEAIRSGAMRLVPVEATDDMTAAWPSYNKGAGHERSIYNAMLSAAPDHTPALLALIEERDRLKVERDEGPKGKSWAQFAKEQADRALAAEAKCDALREALARAQSWHESEDKALSKSGRSDADYHWRRLQHREQLDAIRGALPEAEYEAAWGRMNARYEQETADV